MHEAGEDGSNFCLQKQLTLSSRLKMPTEQPIRFSGHCRLEFYLKIENIANLDYSFYSVAKISGIHSTLRTL